MSEGKKLFLLALALVGLGATLTDPIQYAWVGVASGVVFICFVLPQKADNNDQIW